MRSVRTAVAVCLSLIVMGSPGRAQDLEATFYKAYFLDVEERKTEDAVVLYEQVAGAEGAPADLVRRAKARLAACREELRSQDLAALMPPEALAYLEIRDPGRHLASLLEAMGITQTGGDGGGTSLPLLSPKLVAALNETSALAVSIVDVDPQQEIPHGVVIANLGRDEKAMGLVETLLSAAALSGQVSPGRSTRGHPTYVSPYGTLIVTNRLVIAGNPPELAIQAVERLYSDEAPGLDGSEALAEIANDRNDAAFFAFFNAKALIEKAKAEMARFGGMPEEYVMAQAITDVESVRWVTLSGGSSDSGLFGTVRLQLSEGNRALAYHLLRTPPLARRSLEAIPAGVAAFLACGLSDVKASAPAAPAGSAATPYITGLDFGRELFANVDDVAAFVLAESPLPAVRGRPPIPHIGIVFTVKDVERSRALWDTVLRVGATAAQAGPDPVRSEEIGGRAVRIYSLPEDIEVLMAAEGGKVVLATSGSALAAAFAPGRGSVLSDAAFAPVTRAITPTTSKIAAVHAGRILQVAGPFMELDGFAAMQAGAFLSDVTVAAFTNETPTALTVHVTAGVPRIGPLLPVLLNVAGSAWQAPAPRSGRRQVTVMPPQPVTPPQVEAFDPVRVKEIIPKGSTWKYSDTGEDRGTDWRAPAYDDSAWPSGAAPLGYGEDDLGATIGFGDDPDNKHPTAYFRRSFTVDNPERFETLRFALRRDDGAAVYVNGVEVVRDNVPPDASYNDFSIGTLSGEYERFDYPHTVPAEVLRAGENTIAVEVHQCNGASSDLAFDLALTGLVKGR